MSTTIRPELSDKNKYWIDRHRYYELKHFCLQYPTWKKAHDAIDNMVKSPRFGEFRKSFNIGDPTAECASARYVYSKWMSLIENAATCTDEHLSEYILKAVTEGRGYEYLKVNMNIPCCKDTYYELYRKFFWILNKERN